MMKIYRRHLQNLNNNKFKILITALFVLGIYHLLMFGLKWNVFNMPKEQINDIKPILHRFYHLSYNIIIVLGFLYKWKKKVLWILLYFGFKIIYNILLFIEPIKNALHDSLYDGISFGVLIIVALLILGNEKSK